MRRLVPMTAVTIVALLYCLVPALAIPPNSQVIDISGAFSNDFDCPFPLEETISGAAKDTTYFAPDGTLVRELVTAQHGGPVTVTWTNPLNGNSLSSHEASVLQIYYNPDGSFRSASNEGLTFHVNLPGQRTLLLDVGLVVIRHGQGIVFEAGPHQELNGETDTFCAALE
jgi:hypothetical protein